MKTALRKALPLLLCLILCICLSPAAGAEEHVHEMAEDHQDPTCVDNGFNQTYCPICNATFSMEYIPATGIHSFMNVVDEQYLILEGDCEHQYWKSCSVCQQSAEEAYAKALDAMYEELNNRKNSGEQADWEQVVKDRVLLLDEKYKFSYGGEGHHYIHVDHQEATCTSDGWKEYSYCDVCGEYFNYEAIPAKGHRWGEFTQTKAPTCTEDGSRERVCSVCGFKETEAIPAAHKWGEFVVTMEPTCYSTGEKRSTCSVCGETHVEWIDKVDHKYENGECVFCHIAMPAGDVEPNQPGNVNLIYITFDGNGATSGSMEAQAFEPGTVQALSANAFTRKGYEFLGWDVAADGSAMGEDRFLDGESVELNTDVTLYAQWKQIDSAEFGAGIGPWTVFFNANGGSGVTMPNSINGNPGDHYTLPGVGSVIRQNHSLLGWNNRADGSGSFYAPGANYKFFDDETLYAQWEKTVFTISFDSNGGNGSMAPLSIGIDSDTLLYLPPNAFTKIIPGTSNGYYAFMGWNTKADGSGISYEDEAKIDANEIKGDLTLYAQWDTVILFDANGGYGSMDPQEIFLGGENTLNPNSFYRANYAFSHWNTKPDGSGDSYANEGSIFPTSSMTLYAQWVKNYYSVNYNSNGGGGVMGLNTVFKGRSTTVRENEFNAPSYDKIFSEWNTRPDGSGTSYKPGDPIRSDDIPSDITLYAIWRDKLTISFYPGDDSGDFQIQELPREVPVKLSAFKSFGFAPPEGQTFAYWMDDFGNRYFNGQEVYLTSDLRLTAVYGETIQITYNANGGTLSSGTQTGISLRAKAAKDTDYQIYSQEYLRLNRSGYEFLGWALGAGASYPMYMDGEIIPQGFSQDTTLYAVWEQLAFEGTVTITGSVTDMVENGYVGETLTADVTGEAKFFDYSFQWLRDGVEIDSASTQTYVVSPEDYGCTITCRVTAYDADPDTKFSINHKNIAIEDTYKEIDIVNNTSEYDEDYLYGLTENMSYTLNSTDPAARNSVMDSLIIKSGVNAFPFKVQGTYRFYNSGALIATVEVRNWYTLDYEITNVYTPINPSSSSGFVSGTGSGTVQMKNGNTVLTASSNIKDSSGNIIIKGNGTNAWLVREGANTDLKLTVRPASVCYGYVYLNGAELFTTNSERTVSLGQLAAPVHYAVLFSRSGPVIPVAPIDEEHFPDPAFRQIVQSRFDTDGDWVLSEAEIEVVRNFSCSNYGISSLKGIELFDNLQTLYCESNGLVELDLSGCSSLRNVYCSDNDLTTLVLNPDIFNLYCSRNALTTLDLSAYPQLVALDCSDNALTGLVISECGALKDLYCYGNLLQSLDLSHNATLRTLNCNDNLLGSLLFANSSQLTSVNCSGNLLTALDLSGNPELAELRCVNNKLSSLNLSGKANLRTLNCSGNDLQELFINGCESLTALSCQENELSELDVSACLNLRRLYCADNHLVNLELGGHPLLTTLSCENNDLLFLQVTDCPALKALTCQHNALAELDLGGCTALLTLMNSVDPETSDGVVTYRNGYSGSVILSFDETLMVDKHLITFEFILPAALTDISDEAFAGGAFSSVVIPESVTKVGSRAFADCPNLGNVQILGPSVSIAPDAFENDDRLTIYYRFGSAISSLANQSLTCSFFEIP